MAKITKESIKTEYPVYSSKVLKDLLFHGDFYIANVEGEDAVGTETEEAVVVYGLVSPDHTLVQGFLVDSYGLVLPYNCLTTWAAYGDVWKRVDIHRFMSEFPYSDMNEKFDHFKRWFDEVVEASLYKC